MRRFGVPLLLAAVALIGRPAAADTPVLQADVGPNDAFKISLTDATGTAVTHLDPGTYTIHVMDESSMHDFHLTGPGVDQATDVVGTGTTDWTVTFTNGTYRFQCDIHPTIMKGSFTVGIVATTQALAGSVGPGRKIALTRSAKAGKAVLTIHDRTSKDNFHLTGPGVNKKTGIAFKGTLKWTVTLRSGTYTFRSDAHKTLKGTLKVA